MPPPVRPGFGRLIAPDVRDRAHPMRALTIGVALPTSRLWQSKRGYVLDQGQTPHCVGFAWAGFLEAAPFMHQLTNADGDRFYALAQTLDEWPGTDYDGTSTRGGAKALQSLGLITGEYVWAQTESEVWDFVLGRGPVVTGTVFVTGFMEADRNGYLNLTGGEEGGHDWCIIGASEKRSAYRMVNSWGTSWSDGGRAWVRREDYRALLETMGGDCCSAIEVAQAS
jgi:hypothetical protein